MRNTLCEFLIVIAASTLRFGRCSHKLKSVNDLKNGFQVIHGLFMLPSIRQKGPVDLF